MAKDPSNLDDTRTSPVPAVPPLSDKERATQLAETKVSVGLGETVVQGEPEDREEDSLYDPVESGDLIGSYVVERKIGQGGMGLVYEGVHRTLHRRSAIKILINSLAMNTEFVDRFLQEARLAASVESPHLVAIYDAGQWKQTLYMVQELIDGGDVEQILDERGPFSELKALQIILQATKGISVLEKSKLVHRDIKPSNLFLSNDGVIKVGDFGLARAVEADSELTQSGASVGTPAYMSPEQIRGVKDIDSRSDIYALAVTLYTLLTNERPFKGGSLYEIIDKVVNGPFPDLTAQCPDIHPATVAVFKKAMAQDRRHRYQSTLDFADAIQGVINDIKSGVIPKAAPAPKPPAVKANSNSPSPKLKRPVVRNALEQPTARAQEKTPIPWWAFVLGVVVLLIVLLPFILSGASEAEPMPAGLVSSTVSQAKPSITDEVMPDGPAVKRVSAVHLHGNSYAMGSGSKYLPVLRLLDGRFTELEKSSGLSVSGYPGQGADFIQQKLLDGTITANKFSGVMVLWPARNGVVANRSAVQAHVSHMIKYLKRRGCETWLISECPLIAGETPGGGKDGQRGYNEVVAYNQWLVHTFGDKRVVKAQGIVQAHPSAGDKNHPSTAGYVQWAKSLGNRLVEWKWIDTKLPTQASTQSVRMTDPSHVIRLQENKHDERGLPKDSTSDHTALIWYKGNSSGFVFGRNEIQDPKNRWGIRIFKNMLWLNLSDALGKAVGFKVKDGRWHLLGWRVSNGKGQMIIDGQLVGDIVDAKPVNLLRNWCIAGSDPEAGGAWSANGLYSTAAIWRTTLTPDEIKHWYNAGALQPLQAVPQLDQAVCLLPLDYHRGRLHGGWPDRLGNAEGDGPTLGKSALVADIPSRDVSP